MVAREFLREELPERVGPADRRRLTLPSRLARSLPLLIGALLAGATLVALLLLVSRADASRSAQVKLAQVETQVNLFQGIPWALLNAKPPSAAVVTKQLNDTSRQITDSLNQLDRTSPVAPLNQALSTLRGNIAINRQLEAMIVAGQVDKTGALGGMAYGTRDAILGSLGRASAEYRARAEAAMHTVVGVASAAILILLLAFAFFYTYSIRGRRRAESLAQRLQALAEALGDSEAHLKHAHQLAGIGTWTWSVDGQRFTGSPAYAEMHGWSDGVPAQDPEALLSVIDSQDRAVVSSVLGGAVNGGGPTSVDYHVIHPEGRRLIHAEAEVVWDREGRPSGLIGICQDITERFRLAESERAHRAKNEFISRMSHELRTPLNAILGFGQLLSMDETDERKRQNVDHILSAGRHLLDLINEVLDLSRIEAGRLHLTPQPVHVATVLQDALDLIRPFADERSITLSTIEDESLWAHADVQRLRQVLLNLLSNAVKYNHEGGQVTVRATQPSARRVQITVADDGPGIAPAVIEHLFTPFERLGADELGIEGTGLGLAVSKRMIEAMGGTITVDTEPGNGAAFSVALDAAEPVVVATAPGHDVPIFTAPAHHELVVLSIEDNRSNRRLIEGIFESRSPVQVVSAVDGASGLQLAQEHGPDLVLLDLNLPDMSGLAVLEQLKANPVTAAAPVVILSADATLGQLEQLTAAGAHAYLTKPVDIPALLGVLADAIEPEAKAA